MHTKYIFRLKGGAGSGHHGHAGRPGHLGGSAPKNSSGESKDNDRKLSMAELTDFSELSRDQRTRISTRARRMNLPSYESKSAAQEQADELIIGLYLTRANVFGSAIPEVDDDGKYTTRYFPFIGYSDLETGEKTKFELSRVMEIYNVPHIFGEAMHGHSMYGIIPGK